MIDGLNEACSNIASNYLNVGDDSMSAVLFFTAPKGNLYHLSYISCKPEPLGTKFNTVAYSVTESLILIKIQMRKEGMNLRWYHLELGATDACTKMLM